MAVLTETPAQPQSMVKRSGVPNASAYLAFQKLQERGLVERKKQNGRWYWRRVSQIEIQDMFQQAQTDIIGTVGSSVKTEQASEIYVHVGVAAVRGLIRRILDLPAGGRVTIYQGGQMDNGWAELFTNEELIAINQGLSSGNILFESIIPDNYFEKLIPVFGLAWAESYADRPNQAYAIPETFNTSRGEIHMYKDLIIIFDTIEAVAIEIKNPEVLKLLRGILEFVKNNCEPLDVHAAIAAAK